MKKRTVKLRTLPPADPAALRALKTVEEQVAYLHEHSAFPLTSPFPWPQRGGRIEFRGTPEQIRKIEEKARRAGKTLSAYVRDRALADDDG